MDIDYAKWVSDALARKPHLNQSGLARHLGRHRAVITNMIQGKRRFIVSEIDKIAAYLGEPPPGQRTIAHVDSGIPFGGRIDRAWREDGDAGSEKHQIVSPLLTSGCLPETQAWYAVDESTPCGTILAGDVLIARKSNNSADAVWTIVRRERAGLVNLTLRQASIDKVQPIPAGAKEKHETVAAVLEIRRRVG